jgi:transposase
VATLCGIDDDLGRKGKSGILQNLITRGNFLQNQSHRIRFVYTPKHCSWLNQVEIWFSILSRRLLKRGNFTSTEDLKQRILSFIEFFNQHLAKPFRWTYIGKPLLS